MDILHSPGFLINQLAHLMANAFERRLRARGVTLSQWGMLALLWKTDGLAHVEFQRLLHLDGATVTGLIKRMMRGGLVRQELDQTDRRMQRVYLTEQGRQLEHVLVPAAESVNAQALQALSDQEVTLLVELLTRALDTMQAAIPKKRSGW
jgi:DNA-binding MarR family transcriptional regulator